MNTNIGNTDKKYPFTKELYFKQLKIDEDEIIIPDSILELIMIDLKKFNLEINITNIKTILKNHKLYEYLKYPIKILDNLLKKRNV